MVNYFSNLAPCLVGMEACASAHFWARRLESMGHTVKLMAPQFVKPYVKANKNDVADAEAICEAVTRPTMRFVSRKDVDQQTILSLHRVRQLLVTDRTAHVNQIRGLLAEFGLIMPSGRKYLSIRVPEILEDAENELTAEMRELISDCYQRVQDLSEAIAKQENRIKQLSSQNPLCERIEKIPGIGPLTASAFVATIGKALEFKNGRELSAFLGLVPRQHSSGGKQNLMGISKRGDSYLRTLLIHGARSLLRFVRATPEKNRWLSDLMLRKNSNVAAVALANKNVRIIWALLSKDMEFNPQHVSIAPMA